MTALPKKHYSGQHKATEAKETKELMKERCGQQASAGGR